MEAQIAKTREAPRGRSDSNANGSRHEPENMRFTTKETSTKLFKTMSHQPKTNGRTSETQTQDNTEGKEQQSSNEGVPGGRGETTQTECGSTQTKTTNYDRNIGSR